MKYFIAIALIAAVASAGVVRPTPLAPEYAELETIVAAINSPSTDPATAVALQAMLHDLLGVDPILVGPAIVDIEPVVVVEHEPIVISPAPVNPIDGIFVNPAPVVTPVAPAPVAAVESAATPLVQIIVNVQKAEDVASVTAPVPVAAVPSPVEEVYVPGPVNVVDSVDVGFVPAPVVEEVYVPGPVNVVDSVDIVSVEPVQVASPVVVEPVQVVSPVVIAPIQVGTPVLPTPVEPVLVGTPIITPGQAVNPIESLN